MLDESAQAVHRLQVARTQHSWGLWALTLCLVSTVQLGAASALSFGQGSRGVSCLWPGALDPLDSPKPWPLDPPTESTRHPDPGLADRSMAFSDVGSRQ